MEEPKDFIGRTLHWLGESTWLSEEYKIAGALMVLSTQVRGRIKIIRSIKEIKSNMYFLLAGAPDTGKTLVLEDVAARLIKDLGLHVLNVQEATPEGLTKDLSKIKPCNTFIYVDEMGRMIKRAEYQSGMIELLNTLFDKKDNYVRSLAKSEQIITKPFVTLGIGIQPERFNYFADSGVITTGFMARFLVIPGEKRPEWDAPPRNDLYEKALYSAMIMKKFIDSTPLDTEIHLTERASRMINEYSNMIKSTSAGMEWWEKIGGILLRMSLLFMLNRHTSSSDDKEKESMNYWLKLAEYLRIRVPVENVGEVDSIVREERVERVEGVEPVDTVDAVDCVDTVKAIIAKAGPSSLLSIGGEKTLTLNTRKGKKSLTLSTVELEDEETPSVRITSSDMASAILIVEWMRPKINKVLNSMSSEKIVRYRQKVINLIHHFANKDLVEKINGKRYIHNRLLLQYSQIRAKDLQEHIDFAIESGIIGPLWKNGRMRLYEYLGNGDVKNE